MEFRRMNNGSVRCLISEEDMQEHGLEVTDFLNDKEKVHDFLGIVIEKAKEEVGYVNNSGILSMQVMPLSKGRLSIVFSEKDDLSMLDDVKDMLDNDASYDDVMDMLDEMEKDGDEDNLGNGLDILRNLIDSIPGGPGFGFEDDYDDDEEGMLWHKKDSEFGSNLRKKDFLADDETRKLKDKQEKNISMTAVYEFSSIDNAMSYAANCGGEKITSRFYKDKDKYYLVIEKGRLSKFCYEDICETALEYASRKKIYPGYIEYMKEHYKCVIKKNALDVLKNIVR